MEIYDRVIKIVRPKKVKLVNAEATYASQMEKLNEKRTQLTEVSNTSINFHPQNDYIVNDQFVETFHITR